MASGTIQKKVDMEYIVDITNQCSIPTGTIKSVRYYTIGRLIYLKVQIDQIHFQGSNIWVTLPDSFPGNPNDFAPLSTAYDGMVCVFRTQNNTGNYLLVQCTDQNAYLNLTASGVCFKQ